mgnify:FL=1
MENILKSCKLCPRNCTVNRYEKVGYCKANEKIKVALASVHMWEEPIVSGNNGSGTIFFSNCNLKCVYCQNYKISEGFGKYISIDRFSDICIELQNKMVNNINLVTPTHYVPQIVKGIKLARKKGLKIPVVYNTSSYENVDTINLLKGTIDVYLADLKYYDDSYAIKYSNAREYFKVASKAIEEMYNQVGDPIIENEIITKGVIVRILLLPGLLEDAKKLVKYLYSKYKDHIYISLMNQYTPVRKTKYVELNQKVRQEDYDDLVDYACDLGVVNAFVQESDAISESFIPNFDKRGV